MSESTPALPAQVDPRRNPSYPARIHCGDRMELNGVLARWEARVAEAGAKLGSLGDQGAKGTYEYLYAQMLGGVGQVADCVRRIPGEAGDLYAEDKHRLEQAERSLERLFVKWDAVA